MRLRCCRQRRISMLILALPAPVNPAGPPVVWWESLAPRLNRCTEHLSTGTGRTGPVFRSVGRGPLACTRQVALTSCPRTRGCPNLLSTYPVAGSVPRADPAPAGTGSGGNVLALGAGWDRVPTGPTSGNPPRTGPGYVVLHGLKTPGCRPALYKVESRRGGVNSAVRVAKARSQSV